MICFLSRHPTPSTPRPPGTCHSACAAASRSSFTPSAARGRLGFTFPLSLSLSLSLTCAAIPYTNMKRRLEIIFVDFLSALCNEKAPSPDPFLSVLSACVVYTRLVGCGCVCMYTWPWLCYGRQRRVSPPVRCELGRQTGRPLGRSTS